MFQAPKLAGIGEVLFDVRDGELSLGGAPLNFCFHAHQLLQHLDGTALPVSSVGSDELGDRLLHEATALGMDTSGITRHPTLPTGRVTVDVAQAGHPMYTIESPSAWDHIDTTSDIADRVASASAVCFGTLSQRSPEGRKRIAELVASCRGERVLDVNLRDGFVDLDVVFESVQHATILKLNEHELPIVASVLGVATDGDEFNVADRVLEKSDARLVVLTRGSRGTAIFKDGHVYEGATRHPDFEAEHDAVGAGDATTAAVTVGHLVGLTSKDLCDLANSLGAFVASRRGATPVFPSALTTEFLRMVPTMKPYPGVDPALAYANVQAPTGTRD